jgi:hypothetical protein
MSNIKYLGTKGVHGIFRITPTLLEKSLTMVMAYLELHQKKI